MCMLIYIMCCIEVRGQLVDQLYNSESCEADGLTALVLHKARWQLALLHMYALKPQGMHLPCNMVLLVFTDATVSTAPVLFSGKASSSGIPSKHHVHEIE